MTEKKQISFKKHISLWLPVILWCGIIFYVSSISSLPKVGEGLWDVISKKLAHFTEYAVLALLLRRAFARSTEWQARRVNLISLVCAALYAVSDEFHQSFVPLRSAEMTDVLIDSLGAFTVILFYAIKKKNPLKIYKQEVKDVRPQGD